MCFLIIQQPICLFENISRLLFAFFVFLILVFGLTIFNPIKRNLQKSQTPNSKFK
ncbi:hypothetical protein HanRHA438_Chr11g0514161 [Helianthus annuus]|nr:hypothetical protein HanRHA438_Chr11g0514161 [Helianthus annuus]